MSDSQLTVAELLARRAQETGEAAPRKRRRRRSLEEGGVSVAELTGSLPAVEDKPEQPRHSSQPIDEENDARSTAEEHTAVEEPAKATVTEQPSTTAVGESDEPTTESIPEPNKKESVAENATMVLDVVHENEQPRLTTDAFPAQRPSQMEAAQGESVYGHGFTYAEAEQDSAVEHTAAPAQQSERPESDPAEEDYSRPESSSLTERPTGQIEVVPDEPDAVVAEEPADATEVAEDTTEERSLSIPAIIGMALVAVVIGAAIFKGFEVLWGRLDSIIVSVLAIAMTGGIVGVVHAMRTDRDKVTMALAVVVGLILTFGPRLIVGL